MVASAKAGDALLAVDIPPAAVALRRLVNLAQIVQSHALSFFHLSSPDLLLGMDADPAQRSLFGLMHSHPEVARDGIRLRQIGQRAIDLLAGKRIHPSWAVPGGVNEPLSAEKRDEMLRLIPEGIAIVERSLPLIKSATERFAREVQVFANFPSLFVGLVDDEGQIDYYTGRIRIVDAEGAIVAERLDPEDYRQHFGETVDPQSFLKPAYYKPLGLQAGVYRVGPLARINVARSYPTERAHHEWAELRQQATGAILTSFSYHQARLVEILDCLERMEVLLNDPEVLSADVRAHAQANRRHGVGVAEAPRGMLMHDYTIDDDGLLTGVNLMIATGHNALAMNQGVLQAAREFVVAERLQEGMLNRVEAVIRTFDPCLSCSTHALGHMLMRIQLLSPEGVVLDEISRDG
jgi:NAD-reducing hydrogenase large subunit